MKRLLSALLILLMIFATGCDKADEKNEPGSSFFTEKTDIPFKDSEKTSVPETVVTTEIKVGTPLSFEGLTVQSGGSANYLPIEHLEDIQDDYTLERTIVFRGVVEGLRTPIEVYHKFEDTYYPDYCETKLRVLEPYYGDIQKDDVVIHKEWVRVVKNEAAVTLQTTEGYPPIYEEKEYIFILFKLDDLSIEKLPLYGGISGHYYFNEVENHASYKNKNQDGTATMRENFGYEILDYYLHQPETKLDLRKEASKYLENIPENATDQEILQALPQEKKDLFERMIDQYGTVSKE